MKWKQVTPLCWVGYRGTREYAIQHYRLPKPKYALYVNLVHKGDYPSQLSTEGAARRYARWADENGRK